LCRLPSRIYRLGRKSSRSGPTSTILEGNHSPGSRRFHETSTGFTGIVFHLESAEQASADLPGEVRHRHHHAQDMWRPESRKMRRSFLMLSASPGVREIWLERVARSVDNVHSTRGRGDFHPLKAPASRYSFDANLLAHCSASLDMPCNNAQATRIRLNWVLRKEIPGTAHRRQRHGFAISSGLLRMGYQVMCDRRRGDWRNCEIKTSREGAHASRSRFPLPARGARVRY